MNDKIPPSEKVWDQFVDLIYSGNDDFDDMDYVESELEKFGVNTDSAVTRMRCLVEKHAAKQRLVNAGDRLKKLTDAVSDVVAPPIADLRKKVKDLISGQNGSKQLAFFHKLEDAATEDDLKSLLDDLEKLSALEELTKDEENEKEG